MDFNDRKVSCCPLGAGKGTGRVQGASGMRGNQGQESLRVEGQRKKEILAHPDPCQGHPACPPPPQDLLLLTLDLTSG